MDTVYWWLTALCIACFLLGYGLATLIENQRNLVMRSLANETVQRRIAADKKFLDYRAKLHERESTLNP